ncbi:MAG: hypothetical protein JF607_01275 [Burkholderiales bacterium]|nr:hypothetical protein [Burkholderiales bacterium]
MPRDIRVPIPDQATDLRLYFDEMVENDAFGTALDFSVAEFDELARLVDLQLTGAEATAGGVAVYYSVYWEAFHACDDKTVGGDHARIARGKVDGSDWVFTRAELPVGRTPADDF